MHNATIGPNIVSSEAICEPDVLFPWKNRNDEIKTTVQNFIEKTKYTQKLLVIELEKHLKYQKNRKKTDKTEGKLRHVNENQNGQSILFKHRFLTLLYVSAWLINTHWIIIIKSS